MNESGRSETVTFVEVVFEVSRYPRIIRKSPGLFRIKSELAPFAVHESLAPVSVPLSSTSVLMLSHPSLRAWLSSSETALFQLGRARSRSATPATSSAPIGVVVPARLMLMIGPCDGASATIVITTDLDRAVAPFGAVATADSRCEPSGASDHTTL